MWRTPSRGEFALGRRNVPAVIRSPSDEQRRTPPASVDPAPSKYPGAVRWASLHGQAARCFSTPSLSPRFRQPSAAAADVSVRCFQRCSFPRCSPPGVPGTCSRPRRGPGPPRFAPAEGVRSIDRFLDESSPVRFQYKSKFKSPCLTPVFQRPKSVTPARQRHKPSRQPFGRDQESAPACVVRIQQPTYTSAVPHRAQVPSCPETLRI
eukprot:COSAG03_NODE_398_length_8226_cov_34.651655_3_plen_208_part_00